MRSVPFDVAFKIVVGCAIGLVLLVGAIFFLVGGDFTQTQQVIAALVGGVAGWFAARRSAHISTHH